MSGTALASGGADLPGANMAEEMLMCLVGFVVTARQVHIVISCSEENMLAKRPILRVSIRPALSGTIAQYAKTLPKPHQNLIREPAIEARSRLFDPVFAPVPPRRKMAKRHVVASTGMPMPPLRKGDLDRPDRSELRNHLVFNWSPV